MQIHHRFMSALRPTSVASAPTPAPTAAPWTDTSGRIMEKDHSNVSSVNLPSRQKPTVNVISGMLLPVCAEYKKVKVAHTRLLSVGFWSLSRFLAVSLQMMWVINPAVGCRYFPPGLQLPSQTLRGLVPISLFGEQWHDWCEQFA